MFLVGENVADYDSWQPGVLVVLVVVTAVLGPVGWPLVGSRHIVADPDLLVVHALGRKKPLPLDLGQRLLRKRSNLNMRRFFGVLVADVYRHARGQFGRPLLDEAMPRLPQRHQRDMRRRRVVDRRRDAVHSAFFKCPSAAVSGTLEEKG